MACMAVKTYGPLTHVTVPNMKCVPPYVIVYFRDVAGVTFSCRESILIQQTWILPQSVMIRHQGSCNTLAVFSFHGTGPDTAFRGNFTGAQPAIRKSAYSAPSGPL